MQHLKIKHDQISKEHKYSEQGVRREQDSSNEGDRSHNEESSKSE